jgi:hypothetical protein
MDAKTARRFVTAGHAIFTVANATGDHYTYRVTRREFADERVLYFVGLLTGPNNDSDYTYLGVLDPLTLDVRLTRASHYTDASTPVRVIRWALHLIGTCRELPTGYRLHHEGHCGRCGRTLTTPESTDTGFGPDCAALLGIDWKTAA